MRLAAALALLALLAACSRAIGPLERPGASAVALTGGPGTSMVYAARTDSGVILVDLGWWGAERAVREALAEIGATPDSVREVFLTHSHRDHVGAWRLVRESRFHVAAPERAPLAGEQSHEGVVPRLVERLKPSDLPRDGELRIHEFEDDTMFVLGRDTLRAYVVPGHTAGSAVYLFRGVLFLGDAATYTRWGGFGPARGIYSDDRERAVRSLRELWARIPAGTVRYVCTAHAHCTRFSRAFVEDVGR